MPTYALEARGLSKRYDQHWALRDLNLQVGYGEVFCLLGANGAGKSTTLNLFMDFIKPTAGEALLEGLCVAREGQRSKKNLVYIPELVQLYGNLTAVENLRYLLTLGGHASHSSQQLERALTDAGLGPEMLHRPVGRFSKGMRQKVVIALALIRESKVLLLDEPTSGLDPQASNEFSALLQRLAAQGAAILMVSHDLYRAKEVGHRVGIMRQGCLQEVRPTQDLSHSQLEELYLQCVR